MRVLAPPDLSPVTASPPWSDPAQGLAHWLPWSWHWFRSVLGCLESCSDCSVGVLPPARPEHLGNRCLLTVLRRSYPDLVEGASISQVIRDE